MYYHIIERTSRLVLWGALFCAFLLANSLLAIDFGAIGDKVWNDENRNGLQDPGETGIAGVTLLLLDGTGKPVKETITDENGHYLFSGISAGTYMVSIHASKSIFWGPLKGKIPTRRDAGDDRIDSDGYTMGWWLTPAFNLETNQLNDTIDFGFYDPPTPPDDFCFYSLLFWQENVKAIAENRASQISPNELEEFLSTIKELTPVFGPPHFDHQLDIELANAILNPEAPVITVRQRAWQGALAVWLNYAYNGDHDIFSYLVEDCQQEPQILARVITQIEAWLFESGNYWLGTIETEAEGIDYQKSFNLSDCLLTSLACEEPPVECGECDGKITQLALLYLGAEPADIKVTNKSGLIFEEPVQPGDVLHLNGNDKKGTLGTEITLFIDGAENTKIHTSCSQEIAIGMVFGDFKIMDGYSRNGGKLCAGDGSEDVCETGVKPVVLALEYTAENCMATSHSQDEGKVSCSGVDVLPDVVFVKVTDQSDPFKNKAKVYYQGVVSLHEVILADYRRAGDSKAPSTTYVHVLDCARESVLQSVKFHTSCSQPLFIGDQFGSMRLVAVNPHSSEYPPVTEGEELCDGGEAGTDLCGDGNKPAILAMKYTASNCEATSHSQDGSKVTCEGDDVLPLNVRIIASDKADANDPKAKIFFEGAVAANDIFLIDAGNAGESRLKAATWVHIYSCESGELVQKVQFHTSCSQPLLTGDRFGALELIAFNPNPADFPQPEPNGECGGETESNNDSYLIYPNFPNPFNPTTEIRFELAEDRDISVTIYNSLGQQVRNVLSGRLLAGYHSVNWDGRDESGNPVPGGVYIYAIQGQGINEIRKMTLLK